MQHLRSVVDQLRGCRVLVLGDVMLDEYLRGDVSRISPEAPVPVLEVRAHDFRLGGAANTAANIQALGGATTLVADADRPTSRKTRLVAQQQQIVRIDREKRHPVTGALADEMRRAIDAAMREVQACVVSDYAKGVVTNEIAAHAIGAARAAGVPIVIDPKQRDFTLYRGATVITPNLHELEAAAPVSGAFELESAAARLLPIIEGSALLVTRSADGMSLFRSGHAPFHVPAMAKEVFDVTGAGDTVVATVSLALAARVPIETAIELASVAAAISVSKRGTSTVSPAELAEALANA